MGADHRMFSAEWKRVPGFVAHDWVPYSGEESISDLAHSMANACHIQDGDSLVGCSLGGIVACEVLRLRRITQLFLVGSATSSSEINRALATVHHLVDIVPLRLLQRVASRFSGEVLQMFSSADPQFIRATSRAVFNWSGLSETGTRVIRIHGRLDRVIPCPRAVDLVLDGGHLIGMTHAPQCAEFVTTGLTSTPR